MLRSAYIGDVAVSGGVPIQAEAVAYFSRMTTPPSPAFRDAFNWAVHRWKQAGVWPLILGFWLHCTDTSQAALLSVIGDTPRDAVVIGVAPTFTALKGFSGLDATHRVKYPITSTILASDNVFSFIACGLTVPDAGDGSIDIGLVITSDANATTTRGSFSIVKDAFNVGGIGNSNSVPASYAPTSGPGGAAFYVGGYGDGAAGLYASAGGGVGRNSSATGRSSNYITAAAARSLAFGPLAAYGFLSAAATKVQVRSFLTTLGALLDQLGALP
jgi:hypothetical protein